MVASDLLYPFPSSIAAVYSSERLCTSGWTQDERCTLIQDSDGRGEPGTCEDVDAENTGPPSSEMARRVSLQQLGAGWEPLSTPVKMVFVRSSGEKKLAGQR